MRAEVGEIVRRGLQVHQEWSEKEIKIPTWGYVLLASTVLFFFTISSALEYTFGHLIPVLAMVETPQAILFEPISSDDNDAPLEKVEPELLLLKQAPITSSFRATIKHLTSKGGFFARFRGASVFVVYNLLMIYSIQVMGRVVKGLIPYDFVPVVAAVLLANLSMAWTHIMISEPSSKRWYQRLPAMRLWKKVAGPTAIFAISEQLSVTLPKALLSAYGISADPEKLSNMTPHCARVVVFKILSAVVLTAFLSFLIVIPANVTLTRVQASLLADNEETIVPFDRSFGGKVVPEVVGGRGVIGVLDAWKTFDWNARVRLIKIYLKYVAMQVVLSALCFATILFQVYYVMGDDLKKLLEKAREGQNRENLVTILPIDG